MKKVFTNVMSLALFLLMAFGVMALKANPITERNVAKNEKAIIAMAENNAVVPWASSTPAPGNRAGRIWIEYAVNPADPSIPADYINTYDFGYTYPGIPAPTERVYTLKAEGVDPNRIFTLAELIPLMDSWNPKNEFDVFGLGSALRGAFKKYNKKLTSTFTSPPYTPAQASEAVGYYTTLYAVVWSRASEMLYGPNGFTLYESNHLDSLWVKGQDLINGLEFKLKYTPTTIDANDHANVTIVNPDLNQFMFSFWAVFPPDLYNYIYAEYPAMENTVIDVAGHAKSPFISISSNRTLNVDHKFEFPCTFYSQTSDTSITYTLYGEGLIPTTKYSLAELYPLFADLSRHYVKTGPFNASLYSLFTHQPLPMVTATDPKWAAYQSLFAKVWPELGPIINAGGDTYTMADLNHFYVTGAQLMSNSLQYTVKYKPASTTSQDTIYLAFRENITLSNWATTNLTGAFANAFDVYTNYPILQDLVQYNIGCGKAPCIYITVKDLGSATQTPEGYVDYGNVYLGGTSDTVIFTIKAEFIDPGRSITYAELLPLMFDEYMSSYDDIYSFGGDPFVSDDYIKHFRKTTPHVNNPGVLDVTYQNLFEAVWIQAAPRLFGKSYYDTHTAADVWSDTLKYYYVTGAELTAGIDIKVPFRPTRVACDSVYMKIENPLDASLFHNIDGFTFYWEQVYPIYDNYPQMCDAQIAVTGCGIQPYISILEPREHVFDTLYCGFVSDTAWFTIYGVGLNDVDTITFAELLPWMANSTPDMATIFKSNAIDKFHKATAMAATPIYNNLFTTPEILNYATANLGITMASDLYKYYVTGKELNDSIKFWVVYAPTVSPSHDSATFVLEDCPEAVTAKTTFPTIYDFSYPAFIDANLTVIGNSETARLFVEVDSTQLDAEGYYDFGKVCYGDSTFANAITYTIKGVGLVPSRNITYAELIPILSKSIVPPLNEPFISNYVDKFYHATALPATPDYNTLFNDPAIWTVAQHNLGVANPNDLYNYYVTGQELLDGIAITITYTPSAADAKDSGIMIMDTNGNIPFDDALASYPDIYECLPTFDNTVIKVKGEGIRSMITIAAADSTKLDAEGYYDFGKVCYGDSTFADTARYSIYADCIHPAKVYTYAELIPALSKSIVPPTNEPFISNYVDKFYHATALPATADYNTLFNDPAIWPIAQHNLGVANPNDLYNYYVTGQELLDGIEIFITYTPSAADAKDSGIMIMDETDNLALQNAIAAYPAIYANMSHFNNAIIKVKGEGMRSMITIAAADSTKLDAEGYYDFGKVCYGDSTFADTARYSVYAECIYPTKVYTYAELIPVLSKSIVPPTNEPFISNYIDKFFHATALPATADYTALFNDPAIWPIAQHNLGVANPNDLYNYYVTGQELLDGIEILITYTPSAADAKDSGIMIMDDESNAALQTAIAAYPAIYANMSHFNNAIIKVKGEAVNSQITVAPSDYNFGNICFNGILEDTATFKIYADSCLFDVDRAYTFAEWLPLMKDMSWVTKDGAPATGDPFPSNYVGLFFKPVEFPQYVANKVIYDDIFEQVWATAAPKLFGNTYYSSHMDPALYSDTLKYYYVTGQELVDTIQLKVWFEGEEPGTYQGQFVILSPDSTTLVPSWNGNAATQHYYDFYHNNYPSFNFVMNVEAIRDEIRVVDTLVAECYTNVPYNWFDTDLMNDTTFVDTVSVGGCDVAYNLTFEVDQEPGLGNIIGSTHVYHYAEEHYSVLDAVDIRYYVWEVPNGWYFVSNDTTRVQTVTLHVTETAEAGWIKVYGWNACGYDSAWYWVDVMQPNEESITIIPPYCNVCEYHDFGPVYYTDTTCPIIYTVKGSNLDPARKYSYVEMMMLMADNSFGDENVFISNYNEKFDHVAAADPMTLTPAYDTLFRLAWTTAADRLGLDPSGSYTQLANWYVTGAELNAGIPVEIRYTPSAVNSHDTARVEFENPGDAYLVYSIQVTNPLVYSIFSGLDYPLFHNTTIAVVGQGTNQRPTITIDPVNPLGYDLGEVYYGQTSDPIVVTVYGTNLKSDKAYSFAQFGVLMADNSYGDINVFNVNYKDLFYHYQPMHTTSEDTLLFNNAWNEAKALLGLEGNDPMVLAHYYVTGSELMRGLDLQITYTPDAYNASHTMNMEMVNPENATVGGTLEMFSCDFPEIVDFKILVRAKAKESYITVTPSTPYDFGGVYFGTTSDPTTFTIYGEGLDPMRNFSYAELAVLMGGSHGDDLVFVSNYVEKFFHYQPMEITPEYQTLFQNAFVEAQARLPITTWQELANYYVTGAELMNGIEVNISYRPSTQDPALVETARVVIADPSVVLIDPTILGIYNQYPRINNLDINVQGHAVTSYISVSPRTTATAPYNFGGVYYGNQSATQTFTVYGEGIDPMRQFSYAELAALMENGHSFGDNNVFVNNVKEVFHKYQPMTTNAAYNDLFNAAWGLGIADNLGIEGGNADTLKYFYVYGSELLNGIDININYRPQSQTAVDNGRISMEMLSVIPAPYTSIYANYPEFINAEINVVGHAIQSYVTVTPNDNAATYDFGGVYVGSTSEERDYTIYGVGIDPMKKFSYAELALLMNNHSYGNEEIFVNNYIEAFYHFQPMTVTPMYDTLFKYAWPEAKIRLNLVGDNYYQLANYYVYGFELLRGIELNIAYRPTGSSIEDSARVEIKNPYEVYVPALVEDIYNGYPDFVNFVIDVKGHANVPSITLTPNTFFDFGETCFGSTSEEVATYTISGIGLDPAKYYSFAELSVLMNNTMNYTTGDPFPSNYIDVFRHTVPMPTNSDYDNLFALTFNTLKYVLSLPGNDPSVLANYYVTGEELLQGVIINVGYTPTDKFSMDSARMEIQNNAALYSAQFPSIYTRNYPIFDNFKIEVAGSGTSPEVRFMANTTICQGESTTITAVDLNNDPFIWYKWQHSLENTSVIHVSPATTTTYYVEVMNNNLCSNIDSITITVNPTYEVAINAEICEGENYTEHGFNLVAPETGVYTVNLGTVEGCDSIINLNLTVHPTYAINIEAAICDNETYTEYNFNVNTPGVHVQNLLTVNGCDSIVTLNLVVNPTYVMTPIDASICQGQTYYIGTTPYTTSGTYTQTIASSLGCDSTVTVNLTVVPPTNTVIDATICFGDYYQFFNQYLMVEGTYTHMLQTVEGCDSLITLNLTVIQSAVNEYNAEICQGETYTFFGQSLSISGRYTHVINGGSYSGCDSIVIVNLSVRQAHTTFLSAEVCTGQSYNENGFNITNPTTAIYILNLQSVAGCDSTVILGLTVHPTYNYSDHFSICQVDLPWTNPTNGQVYTNGGEYTEILSSVNGCDSIYTLYLTVDSAVTTTLIEEVCMGTLYNDFGFIVEVNTTNPNYNPATHTITETRILSTSSGCDSTVVLSLVVLETPAVVYIYDSICMGTEILFGDQIITTTGIYTDIRPAANGCDSITQLNVTVFPFPIITIDGNTDVCYGESTALMARPYTGPASNYEYVWKNLMTGQTIVNEPTIVTGPLTSTQHYLVSVTNVVDPQHCTYELGVTVTVNPLPNAQIVGPSEACENQAVTLTATGGQTYIWSTGQTGEVINVTVTNNMSVEMRATNIYGCSKWAEPKVITVHATPAPVLNAVGYANNIQLSWSNTNANEYLVYRDNTLLAIVEGTEYTDEQVVLGWAYCYTVVASYAQCESPHSNLVCARTIVGDPNGDPLAIEEGRGNDYKLYPNPANTNVFVEGANMDQVMIFNTLGQLIETVKAAEDTKVTLDVSNYESGMYLIRIVSIDGTIVNKRMVVTH